MNGKYIPGFEIIPKGQGALVGKSEGEPTHFSEEESRHNREQFEMILREIGVLGEDEHLDDEKE